MTVVAGAGIGLSFPNLTFAAMTSSPTPGDATKAAACVPLVGLVAQSYGSALGDLLVNAGLPSLPRAASNLFIGLVVVALGAAVAVRRGAFTADQEATGASGSDEEDDQRRRDESVAAERPGEGA